MSALSEKIHDWVSNGSFSELLKVEWKLSIREPIGLAMGVIFPILLLILFGFIGKAVGGYYSGYSLFDLYVPTIIIIGFISIAMYSVPLTIVRDREIGWLRRISTTPLSPSKLLASHLVINLAYALVTIVIILTGSVLAFGAPLNIGVFYFAVSVILSLSVAFSLGFVVAAFAPTQRLAGVFTAALYYPLLFLAGLWIQPETVGDPLRSIMWYSPVGAGVRSMLYSLFNSTPPFTELLAMVVYSAIFWFLAIRYFRWE